MGWLLFLKIHIGFMPVELNIKKIHWFHIKSFIFKNHIHYFIVFL